MSVTSRGSGFFAKFARLLSATYLRRYLPPAPCIEHFSGGGNLDINQLNGDAWARASLWQYYDKGLNLRPQPGVNFGLS